jgi:hypothetical protein
LPGNTDSYINALDDNYATQVTAEFFPSNRGIFSTNRGIFSASRGIWSAQLVRTFREAALAVPMLLALPGAMGAAADEPAALSAPKPVSAATPRNSMLGKARTTL